METQKHTFEVLVVDPSGKSEITTVTSLLLAISYSEKLWTSPVISANHTEIRDKTLDLTLTASKLDLPANQQGNAFLIRTTSADFTTVEAFREKLFAHVIYKLGFSTARILVDTVSEALSLAVYPLIKSVENAFRYHLEKALTQKQGADWWQAVASQQVNQQVNAKAAHEQHLKGLVDSRMSLTDFQDLSALAKITNAVDAVFTGKWEELAVLRNRVFSHSVFTSQDFSFAENLCRELLALLGTEKTFSPVQVPSPVTKQEAATSYAQPAPATIVETPSVVPQVAPQAPVNEAPLPEPVVEQKPQHNPVVVENVPVAETQAVPSTPTPQAGNEGNFDLITESILLQELKSAQNQHNGKYVDLKAFVTKTLEPKGYAVGPSYMVAKNMNEKGLVQIYETRDEKGLSVKAIRAN